MNPPKCSPSVVQEIFRSLLADRTPSVHSVVPDQRTSTSSTTPLLTAPPPKNSIRFIENDQNNFREKYDGCRWRPVCTWHKDVLCTNLAYTRQLCHKHNAIRRNKEESKRKKKPLICHLSLPIINQHTHNKVQNNNNDDDDDIEILEDYCTKPTNRHSMNSNVKREMQDFKMFSVEYVSDNEVMNNVKAEPMASSSYRSTSDNNEIEYLSSKTRSNGLNITELMAKNIPPLTEFEEEFLATRLMERFPTSCLMLDAQLFLHNEAMAVVKRNYRLKMDTVAPEYFYDFLLRHPRVALHYSHWFSRCKAIPPSTGCPIDTKVWTLSMIVRGSMNYDTMDEA